MPPSGSPFKADRSQLIAIVAMLAAIFAFANGEMAIGAILFAIAALFSIGGLFWNAHGQDRADAAGRGNGGKAGSDFNKD